MFGQDPLELSAKALEDESVLASDPAYFYTLILAGDHDGKCDARLTLLL